jgi:hypothetical protein
MGVFVQGRRHTPSQLRRSEVPAGGQSCPGKNTFLRLNNIVPHRKANQVTYRTQLQFHHHSCTICFCGPNADVHFAGDVFVVFTIC